MVNTVENRINVCDSSNDVTEVVLINKSAFNCRVGYMFLIVNCRA